MSPERRQRLDTVGFEWGILSDQWEKGFKYLQAYKDREGHCRVPVDHKENGYKLGRWINKQRTRKDAVSPERRQQMDELGFIWDARSDQWEEGFDCLKAYKDREGHCRVPNEYKERGFPLGSWVQTQRTLKGKMSAARRARLDSPRI